MCLPPHREILVMDDGILALEAPYEVVCGCPTAHYYLNESCKPCPAKCV